MILVLLFILGLAFGSFLNVIILRVNSGETLWGRSRCFSCLHKLEWRDLIPVISYINIGGRCRHCGSGISLQYPIVELLTGVIFVSTAYLIFGAPRFIFAAAFFTVLLAISVYDIRHKIIPDQFSLALLAVAAGFEVTSPFAWSDIFSALGAFAFFALLWLISRGRWMGFGDAKIAFSIGLFLGYPGVLIALTLAFWIGAIFGIGMLLAGVYGRKTEVPFAPFLALGAYGAFLFLASPASMLLYEYIGII